MAATQLEMGGGGFNAILQEASQNIAQAKIELGLDAEPTSSRRLSVDVQTPTQARQAWMHNLRVNGIPLR